jgi:hypothetical protein
VGNSVRSTDPRPLTIRATGLLSSGATALTEATVPVRAK